MKKNGLKTLFNENIDEKKSKNILFWFWKKTGRIGPKRVHIKLIITQRATLSFDGPHCSFLMTLLIASLEGKKVSTTKTESDV